MGPLQSDSVLWPQELYVIVSFNGPTSRFVKLRVIWEENFNEEELFGVGWPVEMFSQQPKGNRTLIIL